MILSELEIRDIIKNSLLKESFLSSAVEDNESIIFKKLNKTYLILGTGKVGNLQSTIFTAPKGDKNILKSAGAQPLPHKDIKITHLGAKLILTSARTKALEATSSKNIRYYISISHPAVEYKKEKLETGAASYADYAVEVGGILGGIPMIGNAADVGSGIIATIKDPPDYILAALCFICATPVIGIGVAMLAKPIAQKFGKQGAKKVGQELGDALSENGVKLDGDGLAAAKNKIIDSIDSLKDISADLAASMKIEAAELSGRFDKVSEVVDEIMSNIDLARVSGETGETLIKKSAADYSEAAIKKQLTETLASLSEGSLRKTVASYATKFNKKLLDAKSISGYKKLTESLKRAASQSEKDKILKDSLKDYYGIVFKGKKFPRPKPPGGHTQFNSADEVFEFVTSDIFRKAFSLPSNESAVLRVWVKALKTQKPLTPATDLQVSMIVKSVLDKFKGIKITAATSQGKMTDVNLNSAFFGEALRSKMALNLNMKKLLESSPEALVQTFEHELLHLADRCILTALAGGDEFAKRLISRELVAPDFSKKMASEFLARSKNLDPGMPKIPKQSLDKAFLKSVTSKKLFSDENMKAIFGGTSLDDILSVGQKIRSVSEWKIMRHKMAKLCGLNPMHSNMIMQHIEFNKARFKKQGIELTKKSVTDILQYSGNAAEIFVRTQRLKSFMKNKGFDMSKFDDVEKFFKKFGQPGKAKPFNDELSAGVSDIANDPFFHSICRTFIHSPKYGFSSTLAKKEAHAFLKSFI